MLIVHSTSVRSFLDICLGKKVKAVGAWAESAHDGLLYFYDVKKYMESNYGSDEDDAPSSPFLSEFINHGVIQTVIDTHERYTPRDGQCVTFFANVPKDKLDQVYPDVTVGADTAGVCIDSDDFDPSWITSIQINHVPVWEFPYIAAGLLDHELLNDGVFNAELTGLARIIRDSEIEFNTHIDEYHVVHTSTDLLQTKDYLFRTFDLYLGDNHEASNN